jgi:hypothetical protein
MDASIGFDWDESGKLKCNPLSWENLIRLFDFWLNDHQKHDIQHNGELPLLPTPLISREQALKDGKLVLVAEDHPVSRDLIHRQLELLGYACDTVTDGIKAMQAIEKTAYGLVIADYNMPYLDGLELCRNLRRAEKSGERPRLPMVVLTASVLSGQAEECIDTGMDAYLRKPLKLDDLRAVLERFLSSDSAVTSPNLGCPIPLEEMDIKYVEEVYGSPERVRKVLVAVVENLQDELFALEKLRSRSQQADMIHRMVSGLGVVKAMPLLKLASELEINFQKSDYDVSKELAYFKIRIRQFLDGLTFELNKS